MTCRAAEILVDAGITSMAEMAQIDSTHFVKKIPERRLRAWKFIAANFPPNLVPEQLEIAREIEPLTPPQAVALYVQGLKTLHDLRQIEVKVLNFDFLPTITKRTLAFWQYLAALRLDYEIGPAYAHRLHARYHGDRTKIRQRLDRERENVQQKISRTRSHRNRGAVESVTNLELEQACRGLVAAVGQDQRQAHRELQQAQKWGSGHEISARLLRALADNPGIDKETVIPWILERRLVSKRGLFDLINQVIENEDGRSALIESLVAQWGVGSLLKIGKDSPGKESLGNLLVNIFKEGGDWSNVSQHALKLLTLGGDMAAKLMARFNLDPEKLISSVLQSEAREKESWLSEILGCLRGMGNFDQIKISTILELYQAGKDLIQPFVQQLFKSGIESLGRIETLLQIPLQKLGMQPAEARDDVFVSIFKAISTTGVETEGGLDAMMPSLINWVHHNEQELVPLSDESLIPGEDAGAVPLGVHLLGKGIQSFVGDYYSNMRAADRFTEKLIQHLSITDELKQEVWLHLTKVPGMLFILFPKLLVKALKTPMRVFRWIGQSANNIHEQDRQLEILTLPAPDREHKYVILSDMHRDAPEDVVDEYFFDLSHFSKNRDLFLRALKYYREQGYTVIENGDCEELWFVPSVRRNKGTKARAQSIIDPAGPNREVYALLSELHRQGRYFRTRGNHDDFWVQSPENTELLESTWFTDGPHEFKVWDALIIPEVLTMHDDYLEALKRIAAARQGSTSLNIDDLVDLFPVGLSPYRYKQRAPLFIFHGHQTDFWNCDEHNFLGKTLVNSVGIVADAMTTFPYHLRGIDFAGNPIVKFSNVFARVPVANTWRPEDVAITLSRRIEQSDRDERRLQNDIYYFEILTAALSLALKYPGQKGLRQVQILASHTHRPQSRPHLHLGILRVPHTNAKLPLKVPTWYYNSGTCGWWEGVLWGVEITDFGQPKLFYWETHQEQPRYMPWELHGDIPEYVTRFKEKAKIFLGKFFDAGAVLEKSTQNLVSWEQIDEGFGELRQIDLSTLDPLQQEEALNTAYLWALRHLENRPQTSQSLEISVNLSNIIVPESQPAQFNLISGIISKPQVIAAALRAFGINQNWLKLTCQHEMYYQCGALFFYGAHFLQNSLCNQLGSLLNLFIAHERDFMVRLDSSRQLFSLKLGTLTE